MTFASMNLINFNPDFIKFSFAKHFPLKHLHLLLEYFMLTTNTLLQRDSNPRTGKLTEHSLEWNTNE